MKLERIPREQMSPFARWLMDYVQEQDTSISVLARQSGLSNSALRYLVIDRERKPALETCLKLAHATDTPVEDLLALADLPQDSLSTGQDLQPGFLELRQTFRALPTEFQQVLVGIGRVLLEMKPRQS